MSEEPFVPPWWQCAYCNFGAAELGPVRVHCAAEHPEKNIAYKPLSERPAEPS